MAQALVNHLRAMTEERTEEEKQAAANIKLETILQHIYFYRIHHYVEQIALINILPQFLQQHPKVCFVFVCVVICLLVCRLG